MGTAATKDSIISDLEALSVKRLTPCLSLVIEETADYLFTLSTSSRMDQKNQDQCYQAFLILQSASKTIVSEITSAISVAYKHHLLTEVSDEVDDDAGAPVLSLVALEEFEDTLAIEKIVRAGTERFWLELESIMLRLARGLDIEPDAMELPVSPRTICSAYRQSLQNIDFPRAFLVDADSAFVRKLLPELAGIYRVLNENLASLGLLPDIEAELTQSGSRLLIQTNTHRERSAPSSAWQDSDMPVSTQEVDIDSTEGVKTAIPVNDRLIHSAEWVDSFAVDTLSGQSRPVAFLRASPSTQIQPPELIEASGGRANFTPSRILPPARDEAGGTRLLKNAETLLSANQTSTVEIESESRRIAHALAELRREAPPRRYTVDGLIEAIGFTPKAAVYDRLVEAFKISSGLFDYVFDRTAPPAHMQSPLASMELCFLELSLIDQRFLIDAEHPGRLLVDRVADLVTLLPRGKAHHLKGFIEIVRELNQRFDGSPIALVYATGAITDLSTALIAQQRLNRDRLIAKENATDRIDGARATVVSAIQQDLGSHRQSRYLPMVIKEGLFDQWVVDVLKGASASDIQDRLALLIRFMGNEVTEPDHSLELSDLLDVFGAVMSQRPAVRAVLEECSNQKDDETIETILGPDNWGTSLDLMPTEVDQRLAGRPRLKRAVRAVQKLSLDTWFLHKSGSDHRYLQIVWVNRHNTRFVLSDERGVKQRDLSLLQIASELGRSLKTLTTLEQLSLVEQTLFSKLSETKDNLSQAFADGSADNASNFVHDIERALRRARRIGIYESAISFSVVGDVSKEALEELIANHHLTCRRIEKLTTTLVCALVESTEPEFITDVISSVLATETPPDLHIQPVDPTTVSDAKVLMGQMLNKSTPTGSGNTSANEQSSITPKSLDDAVQEALVRLDSLTHELRLQPIVRIATTSNTPPESAYLVKGQDESIGTDANESQFRHRDIRIATNLIELKEACRLLQVTESVDESPTHLMLRLCHETCLHPTALDRILTLISEHTVGTSQLSFLIPDSVQIRESIICHRLTHALSSIGCHIVIENYNPARSSSESIHELHASDVILDPDFWGRAAQSEPWASVLPQIISDVHHILGHTVTIRNPLVTNNIETSGIDYIERYSAVALSPTEFLNYFADTSRINA